jgi:hypothetical protein
LEREQGHGYEPGIADKNIQGIMEE